MAAPQKRLARPVLRVLDPASTSQAYSRPGMDPRQWISLGLVHHEDPKQVVTFDEEYGQPLVCVTLQPSGHPVHCRIASMVAGNGEGEYHPFVEGDEVVVAIPEGYEAGNPIIIGRCNNSFDRFPMDSVAGQDPTTNTFAFRRRRTPFIEEFAGPIMFRSAPSGAFLSIDKVGVVTLRDGDKNALQISADMFGYQSADSKAILQMNLTNGQFLLQMGDAYFQLSASTAAQEVNTLLSPGPFVLGTSGNTPAEHVTTAEAMVLFFKAFLQTFGTPLGVIGPALDAALAGLVTLASTLSLADTTATVTALASAFATATQKPPAVGIQMKPGLGCAGFLVG